MANHVSIIFTPEVQTAVKGAMEVLKTNLAPLLITLTKVERKKLSKMNEDSIPYVTDALSFAEKEPKFVPPSVDISEFKLDFDAFTILNEFENNLKPIMTGIEDSKILCGNESYQSYRSIYKTIKQAASEGVAGAKDAAEKLGKRFKGQGNFGKGDGPENPPNS